MALLQPKVPFGVFPCACWNPYFCSVCDFEWAQQKGPYSKTDSCNENVRFFTFRTQIVFAYFSKMPFLQKTLFFVHNHPKTLFFWPFFEIFVFHVFHMFSFSFSNIKKTKTKSAHFFSKTLFLTPWQTAKNYFRTPTHYLCFFKITKKHYKIGKKPSKQNLGPSFDATLDQVLTQKTQILDQVLTLQHAYIYISIVVYYVGQGCGPFQYLWSGSSKFVFKHCLSKTLLKISGFCTFVNTKNCTRWF